MTAYIEPDGKEYGHTVSGMPLLTVVSRAASPPAANWLLSKHSPPLPLQQNVHHETPGHSVRKLYYYSMEHTAGRLPQQSHTPEELEASASTAAALMTALMDGHAVPAVPVLLLPALPTTSPTSAVSSFWHASGRTQPVDAHSHAASVRLPPACARPPLPGDSKRPPLRRRSRGRPTAHCTHQSLTLLPHQCQTLWA